MVSKANGSSTTNVGWMTPDARSGAVQESGAFLCLCVLPWGACIDQRDL